MKIENLKIADLKPYKKNAKKHPKEQVEGLAESIRRFGFSQPIVIDKDNEIIIGHGRLEAAKMLGMDEVPCLRKESLSARDVRAMRLIDNRIAETGWDVEILRAEFQDFDFDFTPFNVEFGDFFAQDLKSGKTDPNDVPPVPEKPKVKLGEVYQLGDHRLMCGDSTNIEHIKKLMGGGMADMVFTDPPYNVASDSKNFAKKKSKAMKELSESEWDKNFEIEPALTCMMAVCADNVTIYVWTSQFLIQKIWDHLNSWCDFTNYMVWAKPNPMPSLSKRHPTWNTELCAYGSRGGKRIVNFPSDGHFLSCRDVQKKSDGTHPTQKPIELIEPIIQFSSNKNQIVLDLFGGSGSTMIACEQTGRKCLMMEIDPAYCDVIINRWQNFTGKRASRI